MWWWLQPSTVPVMSRLRAAGDRGQSLPEYLGLVLILAVALSLGASLLPSSELPELARDGFKEAVCTYTVSTACHDDGEASGGDENTADDDADDNGGGSTAATVSGSVGDFFRGVGSGIVEGAKGVNWFAGQVGGLAVGFAESGWETIFSLVDTVTHPKQTWEGIKQLKEDPMGSLKAIWDGVKDPIVEDWQHGNYGEAIGRGIFSGVSVAFGGKGLDKLGKLNKVKPDKSKPNKPDKGKTRPIGRDDLNEQQTANYDRYKKKLPAGAKEPEIEQLPDGNVRYTSEVPGRVPGSRAEYVKTVDENGNTVRYVKRTYDPDGNVVHEKQKYP